WGGNGSGELARGDTTSVNTISTSYFSFARVLAMGGAYSMLIYPSSGNRQSSGGNFYGQLGIGTTVSNSVPQTIAGGF
ncbi:MAG TPA: hypothetical protein VGF45_22950, partial [Polyangia bacterium]